jgi:NADP-dependent aldehyde dehydrogenase
MSLESITAVAAEWGAAEPRRRGRALVAIADALDDAAGELVPQAQAETGLA